MLPEQTTGTQPHLLIFPPSFVCLCQRAQCSERPWMNQCMDLKKTLELKGQVHTVACFDVGGGEGISMLLFKEYTQHCEDLARRKILKEK